MFWVISVAFVLQGLIMVALGPMKYPERRSSFKRFSFPNNHVNFEVSSADNSSVVSTAKTF